MRYYPFAEGFPGPGTSGISHLAADGGQSGGGPRVDAPQPWEPAWSPYGGQPGPATGADRHARGRVWLVLAAAVILISAAATIGVVAGYRTAAHDAEVNYEPRLQAAQQLADGAGSDLRVARSSLASFQAAAASASAAAADVPDLIDLAYRYFAPAADVNGSATAVRITVTDSHVSRDALALSQYLAALGFSDAVLDRMSRTRALDGTQSAAGHHCNVTWTYHPNDGLQMVFEATAGG